MVYQLRHLESYIAWFDLTNNWRVDNGHIPTSKKDAEDILIMLLKTKSNLLYKDLQAKKMNLPKPNKTYLKNLAKNTEAIRKLPNSNSFFKFTSEDLVNSFGKRDIIEKLNITELKELCKACKIAGYGKIKKDCTYKWRRELEKSPMFETEMRKMWVKYGKGSQ